MKIVRTLPLLAAAAALVTVFPVQDAHAQRRPPFGALLPPASAASLSALTIDRCSCRPSTIRSTTRGGILSVRLVLARSHAVPCPPTTPRSGCRSHRVRPRSTWTATTQAPSTTSAYVSASQPAAGAHDVTLPGGTQDRAAADLSQDGGTFRIRHTMETLAAGETGGRHVAAPAVIRRRVARRYRRGESSIRGDASRRAIAIRVQPADAEILIDGERWRDRRPASRWSSRWLRSARVEARKDGYRGYMAEVSASRPPRPRPSTSACRVNRKSHARDHPRIVRARRPVPGWRRARTAPPPLIVERVDECIRRRAGLQSDRYRRPFGQLAGACRPHLRRDPHDWWRRLLAGEWVAGEELAYGGLLVSWSAPERVVGIRFGARGLVGVGSGTLGRDFSIRGGPVGIPDRRIRFGGVTGGQPGSLPASSTVRILCGDDFFVFEPQVTAGADLFRHVTLNLGAGYRLTGFTDALDDGLNASPAPGAPVRLVACLRDSARARDSGPPRTRAGPRCEIRSRSAC